MYKQADIMFMYAETSVHVGGGESVGAIDLAIAREKYTDFPFIPSSGVKGALRDWYEKHSDKDGKKTYSYEKIKTIFGPDTEAAEHAGAAVFTDARILLFPVRSLKGVFVWVTCPLVLNRLKRDLAIGQSNSSSIIDFDVNEVNDGKAIIHNENKNLLLNGDIILEEYQLESIEKDITSLIKFFENAFPSGTEYSSWKERIKNHFVIISDNDFTDFVKSSTEVQTRIKLGEGKSSDTKKGGNLFYQENLPADSLMYVITAANDPFGSKEIYKTADGVLDFIKNINNNRVQLGGNESIGKGIFNVHFNSNGE